MAALLPIIATAVWDVVSAHDFAIVHALVGLITTGSAGA